MRGLVQSRFLSAALGALLLAVLAVLGIAMAQGVGGLQEGRTDGDLGIPPDFTLQRLNGERFTLTE